jgi:hypothetical protein
VVGWDISIMRPEVALDGPKDGRLAPPKVRGGYPDGVGRFSMLASWETHMFGLEFLDPMPESGTAVDLWGDGYPNVYAALAEPQRDRTRPRQQTLPSAGLARRSWGVRPRRMAGGHRVGPVLTGHRPGSAATARNPGRPVRVLWWPRGCSREVTERRR